MNCSVPMRSHVAVLAVLVGLLPRPAAAQLPWMDTELSAAVRTELLIDAMTLDQKIQQMQTLPSPNEELEGCGFQPLGRHVEGIPELAIPTLRADQRRHRDERRRLRCLSRRRPACRRRPRGGNVQSFDQLRLGHRARPGDARLRTSRDAWPRPQPASVIHIPAAPRSTCRKTRTWPA